MRIVAALLALVACGLVQAQAAEDFVVPSILPLTGPAAFVGNGEKQAIEVLEGLINQEGGIGGRPVKVVFHDDQTSPQVAVQLLGDAMNAHPPVILGSTITSMCNAMAPLVADGPVMYCFSPGIHPKAGSFVFSASVSTLDLAQALVRYFRLKGWTRLALIVSSDATGQDAENSINQTLALPENAAVRMVERAHFTPGDVSVAAQVTTIGAAKPQALIAWTTGTALATILKAVVQAGLDLPVATTNGNMSVAQLSQYGGFTPKQLFIPGAYFPPHDRIFTLDPRVEQAQHAMYAAVKDHHLPIDTQSTQAWDATRIVVDGLRRLGADTSPEKLRAYIASLTNYAGISGIYDFKAVPQRGLDVQDAVVTVWNPADKTFDWVSKPGGAPLR
jgi:branched-chain amino acid transport system substrate-binding protein